MMDVVTSMAWRSLLTVSLPLALAACPGDDAPDPDAGATTMSAESSTGAASSTSVDPSTSAADSSTGGTTAVATTDVSTSTGPAAEDSTTFGEIAVCGNNVIEGSEVCDLAQLNGHTCQSLGYQGGQLGCLLTCTDYNLLGCFICGNGVVDIAEDCEETVPENVTCESLGYQAGWVTCGGDCMFDTSDCSICGDGVRQGPEECDGIDYGGQTCASLGFDGGNLACNLATCAFNMAGCQGGQYFQNFEAGVMPGQFAQGGNANWVVDNNMPIAGGFSAHSGAIGHSQQTSMSLSTNFAAAGSVAFSHRVSSEQCCDFLRFYIDGVQQQQWSGNTGVVGMANFPVPAGAHTLEWRYQKDGSVVVGSDRAWVDDILLTAGVPL
jgi:hypothetical protein